MRSTIRKLTLRRRLTQVGVVLCIIGFSFPIYGIPGLGSIKLTFWRLGFVFLALALLWTGVRLRSKLALLGLGVAVAFIILRSASFIFSSAEDRSLQQLYWFTEGIMFLVLVTMLASQQSWLLSFYLKAVFFIGLVSVGFMTVQYAALRAGALIELPFSDSPFGLTGETRPWTYPLYGGGRIIGGFYEPNMAGSMCAFYIAAFAPFILAKRNHSFARSSVIVVALLVAAIALFATGSRQAVVTVGISGLLIATVAMLRGGITLARLVVGASIVAIGFVALIGFGLFQPSTTPFGETQMNVLARFSLEVGGDVTGGRLYWIQEVLDSMTLYSIVFGVGEGSGILTAHNAFLIVLNQNGIAGILLLVAFSCGLLLAITKITFAQPRNMIFYTGLGAMCVVSTWIGLIFMNWAQLNQSLSFMYLALPFFVFVKAREEHSIRALVPPPAIAPQPLQRKILVDR